MGFPGHAGITWCTVHHHGPLGGLFLQVTTNSHRNATQPFILQLLWILLLQTLWASTMHFYLYLKIFNCLWTASLKEGRGGILCIFASSAVFFVSASGSAFPLGIISHPPEELPSLLRGMGVCRRQIPVTYDCLEVSFLHLHS